MRVPVSWLRDYVAIEMSLPALVERLSVISAEVEGVERRGVADVDGNLDRFVVGRVLEAEKHPNADRLQLCRVDTGQGDARQIVCGAWNFGAGATVAVALPGAMLPNGLKLERRKVRGETSDGMILAEDEVDLGTCHSGIMLLPDALEPGTPLVDVLPLVEDVLLVESTGNRPDLLSIYGVAREIAAIYDLELSPPPGRDPEQAGDEPVAVEIDDPGGCPRYIGRLFRNVAVASSPIWLTARLHAAGLRPISNVVDVTNYVMLALGNPLHAFDASTLRGGKIVVRKAGPGEELRTLDGELRKLDPDDLLIADAERGIALAGIMGGEETEIGEGTTDVLLETANFEPHGIFRTSERLRLPTEGSNRWVKGLDPHLAPQAAALATDLLVELTGALWLGHTDATGELPARPVIRYRPERADALIGLETPASEQRTLLGRLGFNVEGEQVLVPTWRARDVTREVDVIEEIARFRLDDVPYTLPVRRAMFGRLKPEQTLRRRIEDVLVAAGLSETYTPSLRPSEAEPTGVRLLEPITVELGVLRTDLLPSLIEAARRNVEVGNEAVGLFEIARVYLPNGALPNERTRVAAVAEGGFLRAKGIVETLLRTIGTEVTFERTEHELFHPGKAARLEPGVLGELHPALLEGAWGAFELDLDELLSITGGPVRYSDVLSFPAVKQDLAVAVPEEVEAGALVAAAKEAAGPELRDARVFDVYRGEQIGQGRKSVALHLAFQSPERTLSDEDAAGLRQRIVDALAERFGAELRT